MAFRPDLVIDAIGPEDNDQCDQFTEHRHDQSIFTNLILSSGLWGGANTSFERNNRAFAEIPQSNYYGITY